MSPARIAARLIVWTAAIGIFIGGVALRLSYDNERVGDYQARVNTALLNFDVTWVARADDSQDALGGGIGRHDAGLVFARKQDGGALFFLPASGAALLPMGLNLPKGGRDLVPERTPRGRTVVRELLRQNDIAIMNRDGVDHLLVSYTGFYADRQCAVGRLASLPLPANWHAAIEAGQTPAYADWTIVFETAPCLPLLETSPFAFWGHQAGGQIAIGRDGRIFLSVGDFGFDGLDGKLPPYPQVEDASYGRILELTPAPQGRWAAEAVAIGIRNPQGLEFDAGGRLWETEHGAMGGDELNLVRPGANFGWPEVTFGVNYVEDDSDTKYWPFNPVQGRHRGYATPIYAWVPSIAPSNLKLVDNLSPRWDGNLLVGALKGKAIVRLQFEGARVVVAETIPLGHRVRHVEVSHGRLYILFDLGELAILTPRPMRADYVDIATVMDQTYDPARPDDVPIVGATSAIGRFGCLECHSGPTAPRLSGLIGSPIGAQHGVDYSPALAGKAGRWDAASLRAFLADPQAFAPGTTMPAPTLSDADVEAIIEALTPRADH